MDDAVSEPDLLRLREPVRRYLGRTVHDEQELDDLVQETLLRVWEVRGRVARAAAGSYAVATARNLVQNRDRAQQLHARHAHRLHEPETVDGPEVVALAREELVAAAAVAMTLTDDDRALLAPDGATTAAADERTARRRSRLARARARARVDYLLHLRRLTLPTPRCRGVLEALSAGDRRQQERTGAAQHLLACSVCTSCATALLGRDRRLFGVVALPLLLLLALLRRAWARSPAATSAATVAAAAAVAGVLVASTGHPHASPAPVAAAAAAPPSPTTSAQVPAAPAAAPPPGSAAAPAVLRLTGSAGFTVVPLDNLGRPVDAVGVLVLSVPADEGFWVGPDDGHRLFVHLSGRGESPQTVRPGDRVSFTGSVQRLTPLAEEGVDPAEGLAQLTAQGGFISVPMPALSVRAPG